MSPNHWRVVSCPAVNPLSCSSVCATHSLCAFVLSKRMVPERGLPTQQPGLPPLGPAESARRSSWQDERQRHCVPSGWVVTAPRETQRGGVEYSFPSIVHS